MSTSSPVTVHTGYSLISIGVTPSSPTISVGTGQQFAATGNWTFGAARDISSVVTWSSSNTSVATVNSNGYATMVGSGSTTITASGGGVSGSTSITVPATGTAPSITAGPYDSTVAAPQSCQTAVSASGTAPLHYQWYDSSDNILSGGTFSGETTHALTWYSLDSNSIYVYCRVTNAFGTVNSGYAVLTQNVLNHCPGDCPKDGVIIPEW